MRAARAVPSRCASEHGSKQTHSSTTPQTRRRSRRDHALEQPTRHLCFVTAASRERLVDGPGRRRLLRHQRLAQRFAAPDLRTPSSAPNSGSQRAPPRGGGTRGIRHAGATPTDDGGGACGAQDGSHRPVARRILRANRAGAVGVERVKEGENL